MKRFDVVVIGGGLSGLAAARRLRGEGLSVAVVEARDRLGGRTWTVEVEGYSVDVGGQWVGPGQDRVLALMDELGVRTYPQHCAGASTIEIDGRITRYKGLLPRLGVRALVDLGRALFLLERSAKRVAGSSWTSDDARQLDSMSAFDWIQRTTKNRSAQEALRAAFNAIFAEEPEKISWLYCLCYASAGSGFTPLMGVRGGAQQDRIVGGAQQLSEKLARLAGAEIFLSQPVSRIAQRKGYAEVTTIRSSFQARFVVMALGPTMCGAIQFDPPLPEARRNLHEQTIMGSVCKCIVGYDRPFWQEQGLSGQAISNGTWARLCFDSTPDGAGGGALVAFVFSAAAADFGKKPEQERRRIIVKDLIRLFGPEAGTPAWYVDRDWTAEKFSGGCYASLFPPGKLTALGPALREPVGLLHFAGCETATRWIGYMDGALEAGERAADEIRLRL